MIEVKLTLVSAQDGRRHDLGAATISLIGTADGARIGRYRMRILKAGRYSRNPGTTWKAGEIDAAAALDARSAIVENWPRASRRVGPWELLLMCLDGLLGHRVPASASAAPDDEQTERMRSAIGDILHAMGWPDSNPPRIAAQALAGMIEMCAQKFRMPIDGMLNMIREELQ